jgi:hypothetical protein
VTAKGLVEYRCPTCDAWLFDTEPTRSRMTTKCRNRRCSRRDITGYLDPDGLRVPQSDTRVELQDRDRVGVANTTRAGHTLLNALTGRDSQDDPVSLSNGKH